MINILTVWNNTIYNDVPEVWKLYFQDSCSPASEGIIELHNNIMFYLIVVMIGVSYMLISVLIDFKYSKTNNMTYKYLNHGTLLEIVWTVTPGLILILIAFPSFKLLYLMDEIISPSMTVKAIGNQWFWQYEYSDFMDNDNNPIQLDSYTKPTEDLEDGELRLLDVDQSLIVPYDTNIRLIVTANDVIHSFALPSAGIKLDAYPGRLNQTSLLIERPGIFYGMCSELCGVGHSNMSIVVEAVSIEKFLSFLNEQ